VVAGVPVVGSAVGGMLDYVVPQKNGLYCIPGDQDSLLGAVRSARAHPLFREGRVDAETLGRMRAYLSPEQMGRNFLQIYREGMN
jgi:glycosyltransferase involved in cell wall biosynthesis